MKGDAIYQPPTIETVPADRIIELLGPVSCGSQNASGLLTSSPTGGFVPIKGH